MISWTRLSKAVGLSVLILLPATPVFAQLADQLASYTGRNASGYFEPLIDAFAGDLYAGMYHTARVPKDGLHVSLEMVVMSARFSDGDKTFMATTESGFRPEQSVEAPTVVGSRRAVRVEGDSGTSFAFPGGFDLNSFEFAIPQLRLGSIRGTEATIRFGLIRLGDSEFGDMTLYGFGARHSVSQYFGELPVEIAAGAFWQHFTLGENERGGDLVSAEAWTVGIQASRCFAWLEPYVGIAYDDFGLDLSYEGDSPDDTIQMSLESEEHYHVTFGLSVNVMFAAVHGEYSIGGQEVFALGLAVGFQP